MSNNKKYEKEKTVGVYLKLNTKTDSDVIEALNSVSNKQGFIKALIRYAIEDNNSCYIFLDYHKENIYKEG